MTPAELAIRAAVAAVEEAGCDVRLTDAVVLLQAAREKVADFVDGVGLPLPEIIRPDFSKLTTAELERFRWLLDKASGEPVAK